MSGIAPYIWPAHNWSLPAIVFAVLSGIGVVQSLMKGQLSSAVFSFVVAMLLLALINYLYYDNHPILAWVFALASPLIFFLVMVGVLLTIASRV